MSYRDRREARADRLDGGEITATAMSSTLATYNLDNMRRSFASLAAEVTP